MLRREGVADADVADRGPRRDAVRRPELRAADRPAARSASSRTTSLAAVAGFHAAHERAYGFAAPAEPTEIVNLRLAAIGRIPPWVPRTIPEGDARGPSRDRSARSTSPRPTGSPPTPIYDRSTFVRSTALVRALHRRGDGLDHRRPPRLPGRSRTPGATSIISPSGGEATRMRLAAHGHPARDQHVLDQPDRRRGVRAQHDQRRPTATCWARRSGRSTATPASPSPATATPTRCRAWTSCPIGFASTHPGGHVAGRHVRADRRRAARAAGGRGPVRRRAAWPSTARWSSRAIPDADAEFIRRVRDGRRAARARSATSWTPTATSRRRRSTRADITLLWRTNPHMDCRDRGLQVREAHRADRARRDRAGPGRRQPADGRQHPGPEHRRRPDARPPRARRSS